LISKVRMSRLDRAGDAIDRVAATDGALVRIVEHAIFGPELVDGRAPTRGIVFTEDVAKIEFTLIIDLTLNNAMVSAKKEEALIARWTTVVSLVICEYHRSRG